MAESFAASEKARVRFPHYAPERTLLHQIIISLGGSTLAYSNLS
jgi:hypothetical protein